MYAGPAAGRARTASGRAMLGGHGLPVLALLRPARCRPAAGSGGQLGTSGGARHQGPNSAMPCLSAWAWRSTLPPTSRWRPAQSRAARALVKKLRYPQHRPAEARQASPAAPAKTTAVRGRATPDQVSAGLTVAQLIPALLGGILSVPAGISLYRVAARVAGGAPNANLPVSWMAALIVGTVVRCRRADWPRRSPPMAPPSRRSSASARSSPGWSSVTFPT